MSVPLRAAGAIGIHSWETTYYTIVRSNNYRVAISLLCTIFGDLTILGFRPQKMGCSWGLAMSKWSLQMDRGRDAMQSARDRFIVGPGVAITSHGSPGCASAVLDHLLDGGKPWPEKVLSLIFLIVISISMDWFFRRKKSQEHPIFSMGKSMVSD